MPLTIAEELICSGTCDSQIRGKGWAVGATQLAWPPRAESEAGQR
jgi:hypothetical protein